MHVCVRVCTCVRAHIEIIEIELFFFKENEFDSSSRSTLKIFWVQDTGVKSVLQT